MGLHRWALLIIGTDQLATSTDRAQKYAFKATGAKLSPIVNGSEQLVSITSLPFYIRQVSLREEVTRDRVLSSIGAKRGGSL